jgi:hypothetical protein
VLPLAPRIAYIEPPYKMLDAARWCWTLLRRASWRAQKRE